MIKYYPSLNYYYLYGSDALFLKSQTNLRIPKKVTFEKPVFYMDFTRAGDAPLSRKERCEPKRF